jgi:hypothetical protein
MPLNAVEIVTALTNAAREVSEAAGRIQVEALQQAKAKVEALEAQTREKITNTLLAIVSKLNS